MRVFLFAIFITQCFYNYSQQSLNGAGGDAIGTGGNVAYSIGQVFYTNLSNTGIMVEQGVQHAMDVNSNEIIDNHTLNFEIFPVPVEDEIYISFCDFSPINGTYKVYDLFGNLITTGCLVYPLTMVDFATLPISYYFIEIFSEQNKSSVKYKVIKS